MQADTRDVADMYAEEGVESCAGMTWREQEEQRERQQDAEIAAQIAAFNAVPFSIPVPTLPGYAEQGRAPDGRLQCKITTGSGILHVQQCRKSD